MLKYMTQEKFLKRYSKHDEQVKEYMKMFSESLVEKYKEIPDVFIVTLDIIAGNLTIMTKAMNELVNEESQIVGKDKYRGDKRSVQLGAFLAAQSNVAKLVEKFGWTPLGKSKIRENSTAADLQKYFEELTK